MDPPKLEDFDSGDEKLDDIFAWLDAASAPYDRREWLERQFAELAQLRAMTNALPALPLCDVCEDHVIAATEERYDV